MPKHVTFELTYGCNLRCVHCLNPTHQVLPQELSLKESQRVLEEVADLGVLEVSFTGGELFTRSDLFERIKHAKTLGLLVTIISNGTYLTPDIAKRLAESGINAVFISIYGATQKTYEHVTRVPGSFNRFLNGLKALASARLSVTVPMPVVTLNYHEILQARALVHSLGFHFQYSFDIHPKQNGDMEPLNYRLTPEQKMEILKLPEWDSQISCVEENSSERFLDCSCGQTKFAITPYGEMNLCVAFPYPKYDLRKGSVREGWDLLKRFVDNAKPNENYECSGCDLRAFCHQGRNDAWLETGDLSACLPHFKEFASLEKKFRTTEVPLRQD